MTPPEQPKLRRRGRVSLASRIVLGATLVASGTTLPAAPARADVTVHARVCEGAPAHPFTPTRLAIPGIVGSSRILALGRDRHGVPRPPPLTDRGKWQLAWDKASRIRPGNRRGVVRLTAHTYPRSGSYGLALGNRLLTRLRQGARVIVSGAHGDRLCYRVVRRVAVPAHRSLSDYYSSTTPARLAILVCSGIRRGPGDWSHRTIWYAVPASRAAATGAPEPDE